MLVLNRHIDEIIRINDNIRVQILGIQGNQIKIGIDAPPEVLINRKKIYQKVKAEIFRTAKLEEIEVVA